MIQSDTVVVVVLFAWVARRVVSQFGCNIVVYRTLDFSAFISRMEDIDAKAQIEQLFSHLLELQKEMEKMKAEYEEEINQYNKLVTMAPIIASTANNYQTLCHLGNGCHVQGMIPHAGKSVHVHVGLGFFVEISWPEALEVAKQRTKILKNKVFPLVHTPLYLTSSTLSLS